MGVWVYGFLFMRGQNFPELSQDTPPLLQVISFLFIKRLLPFSCRELSSLPSHAWSYSGRIKWLTAVVGVGMSVVLLAK